MGCFSFLKTLMFVFNGIIFLGGVAVLGIGIWVKVDGGSFLQILGSAAPQLMQVVNVGYLCMAVGGFLILMGFLGCCGAVKESRCMLMLFFIIILIIFIAEVAGAVVVLAFSSLSQIFIDYLGNVSVKYLHNDYGESNELTTIWNATMKELKCCGFYGYEDFTNSTYYEKNQQYPSVCCANNSPCQKNKISSEVKGCLVAFEHFFSHNGKIVGGVALGICALELAAMIVSLVLFCHIGNSA
ncbi:tetraspanin 16 S homeolog [Xenopus laevis]|uniref:Tetraspanin n=1 Tax=Xenopus laevis TaxID=8355 RepID=Q6P420_XENLA|nr:tetraspanin 16 S homeolog [Xenopus laevis]AAH63728.1 MGC68536 protein [Xenopus laevis]